MEVKFVKFEILGDAFIWLNIDKIIAVTPWVVNNQRAIRVIGDEPPNYRELLSGAYASEGGPTWILDNHYNWQKLHQLGVYL